jgi:hypothetical protein
MADAWSVPFHDTDDYFWHPTEPPYCSRRPKAERLALMEQMFLPRRAWVLSGSLTGWGDPLISRFDAVVFLTLDPATRLGRLRQREVARYGREAVEPGGKNHPAHLAFLEWAAGYDEPDFAGRSLKSHRNWLDGIKALTRIRVIEMDAVLPTDRLMARLLAA